VNHSVGIVDFQGGVEEHVKAFKQLTPNVIRVKYPEQLASLTHLVIPGGESTVIGRYLKSSGIDKELAARIAGDRGNVATDKANKLAVWGTCAGAIILGSSNSDYALHLIDVEIERNAYGRQINSFQKQIFSSNLGQNIEAVFIRAPIIKKVGPNVEILAQDNNIPILCRQNNILVSTFHPELTNQLIVQQYFLNNL